MSLSNKELELQELAGNLVHREVYYCVSMLIYELTQKGEYTDELMDVLVQDDWEEPADDYIRDMPHEELVEALGDFDISHSEDESEETLRGALLTSLREEDRLQEFCDDHRLGPHTNEAYEHWIVSGWLADKLEAKGEMVLRDFYGLTIWGRAATGQAIKLDYVIQKIAAELWPD